MTRNGSQAGQEKGPQDELRPEAERVERRPYHAPRLRHLGSVRELTLGATMGMPEGGGTFTTMGM